MTALAPKVEIGFDLTDSPIGPFFRLDSDIAGRLDNTSYRLGGTIFYDVTDRVRNISINRGKPRRFTTFPAGVADVEFNNHDRAFDPVYTASPFYGNIIPRREIRISVGTAIAFTGWIDDWNLSYKPDGDSIAGAVAIDASTILAKQVVPAGTPVAELTGTRITNILDDVNWSSTLRDLDPGTVNVGTQVIEDNSQALTYLQTVTATEGGLLFVNKSGEVTFRNRRQFPTSADLVTFGSGGIPYAGIQIVYGSELLFNQVTIANVGGGTATAIDLISQETYGTRDYSELNLLGETDGQSIDLALYYADLYSEPEYRVETLEILLHDLDEADQNTVLGLEVGSVCFVTFTPNGIGDPIERYIQVIKIDHAILPDYHGVTLGFQEIKYLALILDDANFGKLDTARLG